MYFSFSYSGKIKKLNGQSITTRVFKIFGITLLPAIPVKSTFIAIDEENKEYGIDAKFNILSFILSYLRSYLGATIIILLITYFSENDFFNLKVSGIALVLWVISMLLGRENKQNIEKRLLLENAIGINVLPEYLSREKAEEILKDIMNEWQERYNANRNYNLLQIINKREAEWDELPMLYAIVLYEYRINKSIENENMLKSIYSWIEKEFRK